MVENLRTAFAMRIEALPWMSDATKKAGDDQIAGLYL